jgi:hypothetical protein
MCDRRPSPKNLTENKNMMNELPSLNPQNKKVLSSLKHEMNSIRE